MWISAKIHSVQRCFPQVNQVLPGSPQAGIFTNIGSELENTCSLVNSFTQWRMIQGQTVTQYTFHTTSHHIVPTSTWHITSHFLRCTTLYPNHHAGTKLWLSDVFQDHYFPGLVKRSIYCSNPCSIPYQRSRLFSLDTCIVKYTETMK